MNISTQYYEKTKTAILASIELKQEMGESRHIKDIFGDASATQSARRLHIGMIVLGTAQSEGQVIPI